MSPKGSSTLGTAVCYTNIAVVQLLLNHGVVIDDADKLLSLIIRAANEGKDDVAKLLLERESATSVDGSKLHPVLHIACENEDLEFVKLVVDAGADVNALDEDGRSCLQLAINHDQICQFLIDRGVDVDQKLNGGYTAFLIAVEFGLLDTVDVLLNARADVTVYNDAKQNALMIASQHGHRNLTKQFLQLGKIDISAQCIDGRTALHYAAMRSRLPIVDVLLSHSPPPALKLKDSRGTTPLLAAAHQESLEVVERILAAGGVTLLEDVDQFGYTALHWAAMSSLAIKEFLLAATLEAGLDPNLDTVEDVLDAFYNDRCACDACGRARTGTRMEDVDECLDCLTNMGEPFLLCQWCLDHGQTCRDEKHVRYPHVCDCDADSDEDV